MALKNKWVTYLDRSYKDIKTSILNRVRTLVPEMTDLSESNLFVIIVSLFAGLIEQLNYYIDNLARELYISTARRYSSMVSLVKLIDYRIKARVSSTSDILVTAVDATGNPVTLVNDFVFDSGTIVKDESGIEFIVVRKTTMLANTSSVVIGVKQSRQVVDENLGTTSSAASQSFQLDDSYEDSSLQITINTETWELKETLAYSGPEDKHFIVEVNESKESWLVFGDGINGDIPPTGQPVLATYYQTEGSNGNLDANTITIWDSAPTPPVQVPAITSFSVTNPVASSGGTNEEGLESIRYRAPLSIRTLNRAVTFQDYKDITELISGVGRSAVKVDNISKSITIYIAPDGGGVASSALLTLVSDTLSEKGVIGPIVNTEAAGETVLRITLDVTARFRRDVVDTENDIKEALIDNFGFNNSDVNKKIRVSDIISVVDNLDKVDYLTLSELTTKPYPRAIGHTTAIQNNWYIVVQQSNTYKVKWRMVVSGTNVVLFKSVNGGSDAKDITFSIDGTDPGVASHESSNGEILISVWGSFTTGLEWEFYTYPYNSNIDFEDYTIPVIDVDELNITVNKQIVSN